MWRDLYLHLPHLLNFCSPKLGLSHQTMLSRRTNPMIGRLSELLVSGNRAAGFLDVATPPIPRSPLLDYRIPQSPRGLKNYDIGGVGLGIVAALEKSSTSTSTRSEPIPVTMALGVGIHKGMLEKDSLEDYTYVTRHGPDNQSLTMVYCDQSQKGFERLDLDNSRGAVKETPPAPPKFGDEFEYPTSDFLSFCHLCKKKLHGRDIYMYRGEKAFCSAECRSSQIMKDERKEQCRTEVQRSADVSASSYTTTPIFSTGILAI